MHKYYVLVINLFSGGGSDDVAAKQPQPAWASVCKAACGVDADPCSAEAVEVSKWSVAQVCEFVSEIDTGEPFAEVRNQAK